MSYDNILLDSNAPLARITINRPSVLNALTMATLEEVAHALERVAENPEIRVLILTGAGEKAFVAGADIRELATAEQFSGFEYAKRGQAILRGLETFGKPVIAAINGFALGGGCELAMACTLRLASETARLGQPEVKLGILAGFGATQRLPRLVGRSAALKLLLTGAIISAQEALRIGLVDEVVAPEALMARAEELAQEIAANAPLAVRYTIRAVDRGLDLPLDGGFAVEADLFSQICATVDKNEGTRAFLEKRPPRWSGV